MGAEVARLKDEGGHGGAAVVVGANQVGRAMAAGIVSLDIRQRLRSKMALAVLALQARQLLKFSAGVWLSLAGRPVAFVR